MTDEGREEERQHEAHEKRKQGHNTYLLAVKVRGRVGDRLPGRVGTLGLDPVVELAVHNLKRRRVAARELGVCH